MLLKIFAGVAVVLVCTIFYALYTQSGQKDLHFFSQGNLLAQQGQYQQAILNLLKALEIREAKYGIKHEKVLKVHKNLGAVYEYEKDFDGALKHYSKALNIRRSMSKTGKDKDYQDFAFQHFNKIGSFHFEKEDFKAGLEAYGAALALPMVEELHNITWPLIQASQRAVMGDLAAEEGGQEDGGRRGPSSSSSSGAAADPPPPLDAAAAALAGKVIGTLQKVAQGYIKVGELRDSTIIMEKSLELMLAVAGTGQGPKESVALLSDSLAQQYLGFEDREGAARNFARAARAHDQLENHEAAGSAFYNLGQVLVGSGLVAAAAVRHRAALHRFERAGLAPGHEKRALALGSLGYEHYMLEEFEESVYYYKLGLEAKLQSTQLAEGPAEERAAALANTYFNLGNAHLGALDPSAAEGALAAAVRHWEEAGVGGGTPAGGASPSPHLAQAYMQRAVAADMVPGHEKEVVDFEHRAAMIRESGGETSAREWAVEQASHATDTAATLLARSTKAATSTKSAKPDQKQEGSAAAAAAARAYLRQALRVLGPHADLEAFATPALKKDAYLASTVLNTVYHLTLLAGGGEKEDQAKETDNWSEKHQALLAVLQESNNKEIQELVNKHLDAISIAKKYISQDNNEEKDVLPTLQIKQTRTVGSDEL